MQAHMITGKMFCIPHPVCIIDCMTQQKSLLYSCCSETKVHIAEYGMAVGDRRVAQ